MTWAYVFDEQERILHVCNREKHRDTKKYFWNDVGRIELDNVKLDTQGFTQAHAKIGVFDFVIRVSSCQDSATSTNPD